MPHSRIVNHKQKQNTHKKRTEVRYKNFSANMENIASRRVYITGLLNQIYPTPYLKGVFQYKMGKIMMKIDLIIHLKMTLTRACFPSENLALSPYKLHHDQ